MKKSFLAFLVTIGTVIGSGFLSGKEIVVFFSRFGLLSYPCIVLAFFLFWGLFTFMFNHGGKALERLANSKFSNILNILICIILCSAMFAGSYESLSFAGTAISLVIMFFVIIICISVTRHGLGSLEKVNTFLVPFMVIVLLLAESVMLLKGGRAAVSSPFKAASIYYAISYCFLNASNSGVLLAHLGQNLTKKQKARVGFFAALVLCLILILTNTVLIRSSHAFDEDMPLLSLFSGWQKVLMQIVVFFGCITTLFSLIFTLSRSLRGLMKSERLANALSVIVPLIVSLIGFGRLVSYFYPISSVLGAALLCDLFFAPFLKQVYKAIHDRRNNAK